MKWVCLIGTVSRTIKYNKLSMYSNNFIIAYTCVHKETKNTTETGERETTKSRDSSQITCSSSLQQILQEIIKNWQHDQMVLICRTQPDY